MKKPFHEGTLVQRGATRLIRRKCRSLEGITDRRISFEIDAPGFQRIIRYGQLSSAAVFLNRDRS